MVLKPLRTAAAGLLCAFVAGCVTVTQPPAPRVSAPEGFPEKDYLEAASSAPVYRIDPAKSRILVYIYREGSLSKVGHDHVAASREVHGYALLPDGLAGARADFYFPVAGMSMDEPELRRDAGFTSEISPDDVESTRQRMLRLLAAEKHPHVRVHAVRSAGTPPEVTLAADLTVNGVTRSVKVPARVKAGNGRLIVEGETGIRQTEYGITPFSVLGGALAVKDQLHVKFRIEGARVAACRDFAPTSC